MADQLVELQEARAANESQLVGLSDTSTELAERLRAQGGRLESARSQVQRLVAEHRRSIGAAEGEATPLELEVSSLEQKAANRALLLGLTQLASGDSQLAGAVEKNMSEAGIQPPQPGGVVT